VFTRHILDAIAELDPWLQIGQLRMVHATSRMGRIIAHPDSWIL
jgi:hypothetical protein